jgi:hypothetical protein
MSIFMIAIGEVVNLVVSSYSWPSRTASGSVKVVLDLAPHVAMPLMLTQALEGLLPASYEAPCRTLRLIKCSSSLIFI